jgi:hypothetical protein
VGLPLPIERLTIESELRPEEVVARLRGATGRGRQFRGRVGDREFRLRREIHYMNGSAPVARGRVVELPEGSRVDALLRPSTGALVFMLLWFVGLTISFVVVVVAAAMEPRRTPLVLLPLAFFAFGYALIVGGFKLESGRTRESLTLLVAAPTTRRR